ncbi:glutamyl aminopeptidase-like [Oratosquilla oratoria]|uniref:glutamyl aminopeptidase-like n=1 Tax=Oratosquilla oratoria TaxID=337810 RepID=UPI003F75BA3B
MTTVYQDTLQDDLQDGPFRTTLHDPSRMNLDDLQEYPSGPFRNLSPWMYPLGRPFRMIAIVPFRDSPSGTQITLVTMTLYSQDDPSGPGDFQDPGRLSGNDLQDDYSDDSFRRPFKDDPLKCTDVTHQDDLSGDPYALGPGPGTECLPLRAAPSADPYALGPGPGTECLPLRAAPSAATFLSSRSIATSKFQPTDARRAFPCFDEPSFKSTFTVTMVRPSAGYIALSNMPVQIQVEDRPAKGLTEVVFQKSVPMVTYLVCFIVCDFESVHALTQGNKDFRVYATSDQIDRTQYALELGVNVLNFFENYFEIEYPLPKQDMIAIPDFVSGAMEHWGLITYRETNLLYDDRSSSSYNKQRVAAVVAHELAHMWFGNLVTLRWWDDLWLNEGFASYIEYKGIAHHEPDWQVEAQFVCSDLRRALDLDSQLSSHPIVQEVNHPDEITEIFDAISYSKGASVLRMLEDFMGSEDFRKGIRNFLRKYIYDNAVTQDLWTELEKTSSEHLNITRIMDSWTRQMGYPVLHVKKVGPDAVRVTQKRFLVDSEAVGDNDSPYGYVWDAAVSYRTDLTDRQQTWFYREADSVTLSIPPGSSWVKLNHDTFGYYRVNYDDALWDDLISAFRKDHTVFSPSDRAGVLDDAFNLAAAELIPYDRVFSLISYMDKEDNYVAWKPVASHLKNMGFLLKMTKAYPDYRRYVVQLVEGHVARLGSSDNGTHLERSLRPTLLSVACSHGEPRCLSQASHLLQQWLEDPSFYIPPNLRSYVYHYGMKSAGEKEWNIMLERYKAEINAQEKDKILMGLVSINSDWILQRFLDVARNESLIRTQNYQTALIRVARSGFTGAQLVWNFITAEWPWLVERYSINDRYLGRMVKYVATEFTSRQLLQRVKDFFAANPEAGAGAMSRRQALEDIEKNIKWIEKNEERLYTWLTKNHPKSR